MKGFKSRIIFLSAMCLCCMYISQQNAAASSPTTTFARDTVRLEYKFESGCLFTDDDRNLVVKAYATAGAGIRASDTAVSTVSLALVSDLSLMSQVRDTVLFRQEAFNDTSSAIKFPLDGIAPGFYQVNLSWTRGAESGKTDPFIIGIDPEKIVSPQDKCPDFDEFWEATLAELASVPMDAVLEYSPEHSNDIRRSYRVEMNSYGGEKMGGYLCVPVKEGKYPVYIDYMGYGANPYWYGPSDDPDAIEFLVSVRDQGIFKEGHDKWMDRGLESKETYYYRGAFCDAVRAVDFVASLDNADTDHIFVRGESQGGAFALISASLDPRIAAAAPAVPFGGDYRHYSQIVRWPIWEVLETAERQGISHEDIFVMLSYFDVKNFADRIKCPVFMSFGLQDLTCPPHTNFAGYNLIKAEKQYLCVPACGHAMWKEKIWPQKRAEWFRSLLEAEPL